MKKIILFVGFLSNTLCYGQDVINYKTIDTQPLRQLNYSEIIGSPYFMENNNYKVGLVVVSPSEVYKDGIKLLYNQLTDEVTFKYDDTSPQSFKKRPLSFVIFTLTPEGAKKEIKFSSGFQTAQDQNGMAFYQVLVDADNKLLKKTNKVIREQKAYGESTVKKIFDSTTRYFLFREGKLENIYSYKDFILLHSEMKSFIETNRIKKSKEANFIVLTNHLNTLK